MRSLAAIAFSFSAAILLLGLLPAGSWIFWAAGLLAAAGGCVLLLPRLRARRRRIRCAAAVIEAAVTVCTG